MKITFEIQYAAKQTIYAAFEREITQNFQLKKSLTYFKFFSPLNLAIKCLPAAQITSYFKCLPEKLNDILFFAFLKCIEQISNLQFIYCHPFIDEKINSNTGEDNEFKSYFRLKLTLYSLLY